MVLSKEEMELVDPNTPIRRRVAIRLGMLVRFIGSTTMIFIATSLVVIAAIIVFFVIPEVMYAIWG